MVCYERNYIVSMYTIHFFVHSIHWTIRLFYLNGQSDGQIFLSGMKLFPSKCPKRMLILFGGVRPPEK